MLIVELPVRVNYVVDHVVLLVTRGDSRGCYVFCCLMNQQPSNHEHYYPLNAVYNTPPLHNCKQVGKLHLDGSRRKLLPNTNYCCAIY
jgi:hypothetical protein